ncbi:hypothetical protein WISP_117848 [Willisornis vidua]|uniref:Uncharacterized protein n=1 Tax=Willisornis vidua TaxID=1566151 RepID=A0ABQ9CTE6_9PASS|nr:hypothetical protein WISP_117848 [Willisornis vidua]
MGPVEGQMAEELEHLSYNDRLKEQVLFIFKKRELKGDLISVWDANKDISRSVNFYWTNPISQSLHYSVIKEQLQFD